MANPTQVEDLEALWRPLSDAEKIVAQSWLDAAWTIVTARFPNIDARIGDGSLNADLVSTVVSSMVLRVLRNPDGKRQESIDDYSWTRDNAVSSGLLYITPDELSWLGSGGPSGAFTITPYGAPDTVRTWTSPTDWV